MHLLQELRYQSWRECIVICCGQYTLDIYQPFWKYLRQYIENVYQFDSKSGKLCGWCSPVPIPDQRIQCRKNQFLRTSFPALYVSPSFSLPFFFMIASDKANQALQGCKLPKYQRQNCSTTQIVCYPARYMHVCIPRPWVSEGLFRKKRRKGRGNCSRYNNWTTDSLFPTCRCPGSWPTLPAWNNSPAKKTWLPFWISKK